MDLAASGPAGANADHTATHGPTRSVVRRNGVKPLYLTGREKAWPKNLNIELTAHVLMSPVAGVTDAASLNRDDTTGSASRRPPARYNAGSRGS